MGFDLDDLPPKIKKQKTARSRIHAKLESLGAVEDAIHGYLACVSYADALVGSVLAELDRLGVSYQKGRSDNVSSNPI